MNDKKIKVLLVEDQFVAQLAAKIVLQNLNCKIDMAKNGVEALELADTNFYDIILLDLGLPDIDGIKVTTKIREKADCKNNLTPIIVLTAHTQNDYDEKCREAGINSFLSKPLTETNALKIINEYVFFNRFSYSK